MAGDAEFVVTWDEYWRDGSQTGVIGQRFSATGLKLGGEFVVCVLLKSKETGHLSAVAPVLDRLEQLRFRLDSETRQAVLKLAGEA
jgi:predicted nucleic acid-binding protein